MNKVVSFYYYISGGILAIGGLFDLLFTSKAQTLFAQQMEPGKIRLTGLLFLAISLFAIFLGRGIGNLKKWALITAFTVSTFGLIWALYGILVYQGIISVVFLIVNSVITLILLLNKRRGIYNSIKS